MSTYDDHLQAARDELDALLDYAEQMSKRNDGSRVWQLWQIRADRIRTARSNLNAIPGIGAVLTEPTLSAASAALDATFAALAAPPRCAVCGGPDAAGNGCEFCPAAEETGTDPEAWRDEPRADEDEPAECEGHPAGPSDPMGQTVYCDGSCRS